MSIVEFLEARIEEDRTRALNERLTEPQPKFPLMGPGRMLAECQAKRAIIALHTYEWMGPDDAAAKGCEHDYEDWPCPTLRHLATVYADHEDYREEWRL